MMNSRKSWVNLPLLKNIIRNNLFPAKVSLLTFFGFFALSLLIGADNGISYVCFLVYGASAIILTTIYPCFIQSYLINKTTSSLVASIPLSSRCIWFTNYLAGYLIALGVLLVEGIAGLFIDGVRNTMVINSYESAIRFIAAIFILLFIYYTIAYLVCCLSGNRLGQVIFSIAVYCLPVIVLFAFQQITPYLVMGGVQSINDNYLYFSFPLAAGLSFISDGNYTILGHVILSIVVLECSYFVYQRRDNAYIGEPLVYLKIGMLLKVASVALISIIGFYLILVVTNIDINFGTQGLMILFVIYMMIGILVSIIVEIVFRGEHIYRTTLIYLPVLAMLFITNYVVANNQYKKNLAMIETASQAVGTVYNENTSAIQSFEMKGTMLRDFMDYIDSHRGKVRYRPLENECSHFTITNIVEGDYYYNYVEMYPENDLLIDYFHNQGKKYFEAIIGDNLDFVNNKYLEVYTNERIVYLNQTQIQNFYALVKDQKIRPEELVMSSLLHLVNGDKNYYVLDNDLTNTFLNDENIVKQSQMVDKGFNYLNELFEQNFNDYRDDLNTLLNKDIFSRDTYYDNYTTRLLEIDDSGAYYQIEVTVLSSQNAYDVKLKAKIEASATGEKMTLIEGKVVE